MRGVDCHGCGRGQTDALNPAAPVHGDNVVMNISEPDPQATKQTPFERVGGESAVRALVDRFYDLMDLEPGFLELRALHPSALDGSRDKLFWFLCGWLGGPQHYTDRY